MSGSDVRMRLATEHDKEDMIKLLVEGFPLRNARYWQVAWHRLTELAQRSAQPVLGHVITVEGKLVGLVLYIERPSNSPDGSTRYVNLSSWYVKPDYRSFATLLLSRACKNKEKTFLNVSAAVHTFEICEALGFKRYSTGQLATPLLMGPAAKGRKIEVFRGHHAGLSENDNRLLIDHVGYGCICLVGTADNESQPFIIVHRMIKNVLPSSQLIYCRSLDTFIPFARSIGILLARRGIFSTILDSRGAIKGLRGRYYEGRSPKYYKGPLEPTLCDLSYTELALFGI